MEMTALTYSLRWLITFSYLNEEWEEYYGNWNDHCIKLSHKNSNICLVGETIGSKTAWMFDIDSLDILACDLLIISILPNIKLKKNENIQSHNYASGTRPDPIA